MVSLTDLLKQCGFLAVAAQEVQEQHELEDGSGKWPRVRPYGAALVNRLVARVAYIPQHMSYRLDQGMIAVVLEQHGRTAPGPKPSSTGCSNTGRSSLSDKGSLPTLLRSARQALSFGHHLRASCSEQPGSLWLNVSPNQLRPGR